MVLPEPKRMGKIMIRDGDARASIQTKVTVSREPA